MRFFLDSNVLLSACLRQRSRQYAFFALAQSGHCRLLASSYVLEEARRNLARKAPHGLVSLIDLSRLVDLAPEPTKELVRWAEGEGLPIKDAPILAAAVAVGADLLVTGDRRHFGPLFGRTFRGVRVVSLADGLALVIAAAERGG